jgi:hypothetical protein
MEYHTDLLRKIAGGDGVSPRGAEDGALSQDILRRFYDAWDFDFLWTVHDGFIDWNKAGRSTDLGHAMNSGSR